MKFSYRDHDIDVPDELVKQMEELHGITDIKKEIAWAIDQKLLAEKLEKEKEDPLAPE